MKKTVLMLITTMLLIACSGDSNPGDGLPPETQTGANTFGCLIDGKLLVPRSGNNSLVFPLWGAILWGGIPNSSYYRELEIRDYKSSTSATLLLHMDEVNSIGNYVLNESNGMNSIDGLDQNYLHCTIFDDKTNSYQQYISYENSGNFTIKRLTQSTAEGTIISGSFDCKLRNINNPNDEIEITKGRFDVNSLTLMQTYFP
ncbi:hypothetical protein IVB69_11235 [Flavobacterium sp. J49]|uniref:hypothetical protein n=1 Tax=Flavobacterium sp. J49 TaxID=2718534 RepID=UPI00159390D7|nr:hypothetical protein [Flavobacterium sp. J49]MBF6642055.1 hypothetical protein [Flavobacterium sp. J49]NIC03303.1 hypothetical protein [Flavobacterium sp. J49]